MDKKAVLTGEQY